jgi:predicted transcriptional regulator
METISVHKTSEKVLIWMHRNNKSGQEIAKEAGITRQGFSKMMSDNIFSIKVLMALKRLGYKE